jgi:hypothetical protein
VAAGEDAGADAVAADLADPADAHAPPPAEAATAEAPAQQVGRRSMRATLAIEAPVTRRRDGTDPGDGGRRAAERKAAGPPPGPRVVPTAESGRDHLSATREYPALKLTAGGAAAFAASAEDGSTWQDHVGSAAAVAADSGDGPGAGGPTDVHAGASADELLDWDDEARRELEEDRRRRTLLPEDVDLSLEERAAERAEERGEDTNPRAEAPEGLDDE